MSWVRESAIDLRTTEWDKIDSRKLSALDETFKGKRFVYLGEPDHGIHEKYDYRLLLIRYLFEKGWRHIGVEAGFSGGKKLDRYLETGDTAYIDAHYKRYSRQGREDRAKSIPGARDPEFLAILRDEKTWFLEQLRSLCEARPPGTDRIHWFGFDLDSTPGGGYADAEALVRPHESNALVQSVLRRLVLVDGETRMQEVQRLRDLLGFLGNRQAELRQCLGEDDARELQRCIRCLADSFRFAMARQAGPDSSAWRSGMAEREEIMCRQLDEWIDGLAPVDKIILLGHNFHLAKLSTAIRVEGTSISRRNIGTHLADRFPGQVCSIWMLYDRGRHLDAYSKPYVKDVPSRPGTITQLLAQAGTRFVLPLHSGDSRESYLRLPREFVANGEFRASAVLPQQADVLFFLAEASELRGR
ncbi:MAG: erythromycin esterase family protein [Phycisphaerales bacterium]|nr:MAG: erythromycin esterase family protein [Phycisphaerales bacterium]